MSTDLVEKLAVRLDKPVATILVSQDDRTKHFIGEVMLAGAALYLLKRYADKYLEGLGFDDIAKAHGKKTAAFLERLYRGSLEPKDLEVAKADFQLSLVLASSKPINADARLAARSEVVDAIVRAGALRNQARDEAAKVAEVAETMFTD